MAIPQVCARIRQPRLRVALLSGAALLLAGPAAAQVKSVSNVNVSKSVQLTVVSPQKVTTAVLATPLVAQPALVPAPTLTTLVPIFHDPQPVPGLAVVAPTVVSFALPSTAAVVPVQTISPVLTSVSPILQPTPAPTTTSTIVNTNALSTFVQSPTPTSTPTPSVVTTLAISPTLVSTVQTPTTTSQPTSTFATTALINTAVVTPPPAPGVTTTLAGLRVAALDQAVTGPSPTVNAGLTGTFLQPNLMSIAPMQTCSATGCQTSAVPDSRLQTVTQLGGLMSSTPGFQGPGYIMSQAPVVPPGGGSQSGSGAGAQANAGGVGSPGSQGNAPVQVADLGAGGGGVTGRGAGGGQTASAAALDGMVESIGQGGGPAAASGGARAVLVNFASQRADEGLVGEIAIGNALANIAPAAGTPRPRRFAVDLNGDGLIQFHVSEHTLARMQHSATPGARVLDDVVNVGPQANAAVKVENGEIVIQ
jgi:hypothetical protein